MSEEKKEVVEDIVVDGKTKKEIEPKEQVIKLGVEETKKVLDFAAAFGSGIVGSMMKDTFTLTDIPNFLPTFQKLIPTNGLANARLELLASDSKEVEEIREYAKNLGLDESDIESVIGNALVIVLDIWHFVDKHFKIA